MCKDAISSVPTQRSQHTRGIGGPSKISRSMARIPWRQPRVGGRFFFNGLIAWHLGFVNVPFPATRREGLHPTQGPASSRGEILGNFPYLNQQRADGEFMQQKSLDEASVRRLILRVLHYTRYLVVGRLISRHPSRRAVLASS